MFRLNQRAVEGLGWGRVEGRGGEGMGLRPCSQPEEAT